MLDRRFIRENADAVREAIEKKSVDLDIQELLALDDAVRALQRDVDQKQTARREIARMFRRGDEDRLEEQRRRSVAVESDLAAARADLRLLEERLTEMLLLVPAIPWEGAPVGAGEAQNVVIETWGTPKSFEFVPLSHIDLMEQRGWVEFERARRASGQRAYTLRNDAVFLERALQSFALDMLRELDFTIVSVPTIVKNQALVGTGMFPKGRDETYALGGDDFLAGTGEVSLVGMYSDEILDIAELPLSFGAWSPCFRSEIGSAGRDVRGLIRVHQFQKVEQFVICEASDEESAIWHARLLANSKRLLEELHIPYEVLECSTGDMGAGKYRMNDINAWFPSLETYRETHSCSSLHEWQARRANIRYRDEDGSVRFAHTLNNTAVATPRLLAALIENHQTPGGRVTIPVALRPYLGGAVEL